MARHDSVIDKLSGIAMFAPCSAKELRLISRLATAVAVAEGQVLTVEGEPGHEFGIVLEGTATVSQGGRVVATLGPGGHYGEMALLDDGPRTATIVAASPMSVAVVARAQFSQLLDEVPAISRAVLRGLARRLREVDAGATV